MRSFFLSNRVTGLDFDPSGETVATLSSMGDCIVSDLNTDYSTFCLKMNMTNPRGSLARISLFYVINSLDVEGRCRWSINSEEPLLFIKYDRNQLNVLDVEKRASH